MRVRGRYRWLQRLLLLQAGGVVANALLAALALALPVPGLSAKVIVIAMATIAAVMLAHGVVTVCRQVPQRGFSPP